jgi:hypothetical protein
MLNTLSRVFPNDRRNPTSQFEMCTLRFETLRDLCGWSFLEPLCIRGRVFLKIFGFFPLTFRPLFWPENEGAQKVSKNHQFPISFCQKVTKKLQKARKIVNIGKSLCHHLNPLLQKHLTPFFLRKSYFTTCPLPTPKIRVFSPKIKPGPQKFPIFLPPPPPYPHFSPKNHDSSRISAR